MFYHSCAKLRHDGSMAYTKEFQAQLQRWRGQHDDGLSWDMVRMGAERKSAERLRATPDRRLFESMTAMQLEAWRLIGKAYGLITAGMGSKAQSFELVDGTPAIGNAEYGASLMLLYGDWRAFCAAHKLDAVAALDVIFCGYSVRSAARARRKDPRTVRENLIGCLDAWWGE